MRKSEKSHNLMRTPSVGLKKTHDRNKMPSCNLKIDYESLLKNVDDVTYLLNDQGYFVFIEQVLGEFQTLSLDHFLGLHFSDIVPLMDRELIRKNLAKVMRGDKLPPFALEFGSAGGNPVVLEFVIEAIHRGNEVIGAIGSSRLITRHERSLAQAGSTPSNAEQDDESIVVMDVNENLLHLRDSFVQMHVYPSEGLLARNLSHSTLPDSIPVFDNIHELEKRSGNSVREKRRVLAAGGEFRSLASRSHVGDDEGSPTGMIAEKTDMGELKSIQEKLRKANAEMKFEMKRKMKQLEAANEFLVKEKLERQTAQQALKKLEDELKVSTKNLEEMNVALDVLCWRKNRQNAEVEKKVLANISHLVGPYLQDLRATRLDERQKAFISILEANLAEVTSSFSHKLTANDAILTPTELKVANMVKEGRSSKEIASLLNLSIKTIDSHRARIRLKLGIKNKKTNLRTHLLTLK